MKRFGKIKYTLSHRRAFRAVEKQVLGKNTVSGWLHDIDKVLLYPILGEKITGAMHRKLSSHHVPRCLRSEKHIVQAIIDWECARFTKPDKPLNAYDTMCKYYKDYEDALLPVLRQLGLAGALDNTEMS